MLHKNSWQHTGYNAVLYWKCSTSCFYTNI